MCVCSKFSLTVIFHPCLPSEVLTSLLVEVLAHIDRNVIKSCYRNYRSYQYSSLNTFTSIT